MTEFSNCRHRPSKRRGILTLEWVLLTTVLVIGIIGGMAAVRDAIIDEMHDVSQAIGAMSLWEDEQAGALNSAAGGPVVCPPGDPNCSARP